MYGYARENLSLISWHLYETSQYTLCRLSLFSFLSSDDLKEGLLLTMRSKEDLVNYLPVFPLLQRPDDVGLLWRHYGVWVIGLAWCGEMRARVDGCRNNRGVKGECLEGSHANHIEKPLWGKYNVSQGLEIRRWSFYEIVGNFWDFRKSWKTLWVRPWSMHCPKETC